VKSAITLTFHKVKTAMGTSKSKAIPLLDRYAINYDFFQQLVDIIHAERCCTISEYLKKKDCNWLILTFDDGFLSDYEIVFPILKTKGIKATFFINERNIGLPGYLELSHLKEMAKDGMEIGSHGLTHRYLITMDKIEVIREIEESKEKLEQKIGVEVKSFAPVGGHYKNWMKIIAYEKGYNVFATMIPGKTKGGGDFIIFRRNQIKCSHNIKYVFKLINSDYRTLLLNRLRYNLLRITKTILGINNYDLIKNFMLTKNY